MLVEPALCVDLAIEALAMLAAGVVAVAGEPPGVDRWPLFARARGGDGRAFATVVSLI
ncbi:MAG: hypothetical protein ACRDRA_05745 [Pseudonocardiaceae bacterium]